MVVIFGSYDAKINVGCLSLASEITVTFGSVYDAKINVGCLLLRSEMNGRNIRLRMTLK